MAQGTPNDKTVSLHSPMNTPAKFVFATICAVLCGLVFAVEAVDVFAVRNAPVVTGHVVSRTPIQQFLMPRADLTIRIDGTDAVVHARIPRDLMAKAPEAVRFHYSGDPSREVFLYELETDPWWAVLIFWGGALIVILAGWMRPPKVPADEPAPVLGRYRTEALKTPMTPERIPDPKFMTKPAAYYAEMHRTAVALYDRTPAPAKGDALLIYACQVHAQWGLIYSGEKAVPYALEMLKSSVPEAREDGAAILGAVGKCDSAVDALLGAFQAELARTNGARPGVVPLEPLGSLVIALGRMKNRKVIPALASILQNPEADGDTRWITMESLGKLVRVNFGKKPEPLVGALEWLDKHGYSTGKDVAGENG